MRTDHELRRYDGRPVDWDGHVALFHDTERQRRIGVAEWARRGLELGAKVIYIEPPDEPDDRRLVDLLAEHAVDVADALARGRLEVFSASRESYSPAWQDSKVDEALEAGYPAVWWSGEARTAWGVMTPSAHADTEWETDAMCQARPVSVLCQYEASLPQAMLQTVCAMHGAGVRESQFQTSPVQGGVAVAGSVDASNERLLRSALVAATARATTEARAFTIELRDLEFLDVAGARAFMTGTTSHRIHGGTVRLSGPRRPVDSLLQLLGIHQADGFELKGAT